MMFEAMIHDLLQALLLATLASSVAMTVILLLRKPVRRRFGAAITYALWLLVPLAAASALLPAPVITEALPAGMQDLPRVAAATNVFMATPMIQPVDISSWLFAAWLAGLGIALGLFVRQQRRFVRGLGKLSRVDADTNIAQTTAGCPALVGAWRPRIVLPADFAQRYNSDERELILAHERNHRVRGDAQINALVALLRGVFWFNPLIHFAASRLRFDQELACDASVIARFPQARRSYADAMLKTQLAGIGLPIGCYWQATHPLKERIAMLKQPLPGRGRGTLGIVLAATLIVGGTYAAWAAQPARHVAAAMAATRTGDAEFQSDFQLSIDGQVLMDTYANSNAKPAAGWQVNFMSHDLQFDDRGHPHLRNHAGQSFSVTASKGNEHWEVQADVSPAAPRKIKLNTTIAHNGTIVGRPAIIMNEGQQGVISVGDDKAKPDRNSAHLFFKVTASQVHSDSADKPASLSQKVGSSSADSDSRSPTDSPRVIQKYRETLSPEYPLAAIKAEQQGKVILEVQVDAQGNPTAAKVVKAEPPETEATFGPSSIAAVMKWKFDPKIVEGKPVRGKVKVPFTFELHQLPGSEHATSSASPAIHVNENAEAKSPDHPAGYRKMSALAYPEKIPADSACVALVTLKTNATGAITDLAALTMHGDMERHTCRSWAGRTASSIMANHWTFEPATVNGKPVASEVIVPVVLTAHANDSFDSSSIPNGALHAVRVSPSEPPSAGDVPASENVEFRRMHPPRYPAAELKAKQHGKVVLKVLVDARGNPKEATVYQTDPTDLSPAFGNASIAAVMDWTFHPARKNGKRVDGWVFVPFTYTLTQQ